MIEVRVFPLVEAAPAIARIKALAVRWPGEHGLRVWLAGSERSLLLGPEWRFEASPECVAELGEFGQVTVAPD